MAVVTKIPATKNKFTSAPVSQTHKRRVAAYARVSTDKDEQITSYKAQVDYYTKMIRNNEDWEFVDRTQVIADCAVMRDALLDTSGIQAQIAKVDEEMEITAALVAAAVKENATLPQSQEEYNKKYAALEEQFTAQKKKRTALEEKIEERKARAHELDLFIDALTENDLILSEWDEQLWLTLVEKGTVLTDGSINFLFKDGTEILAAE